MNVLIAGAGAIGGLLGARLHAAGHDVTLLARPAVAEAIRRDGLTLHGHTDGAFKLPCITEPEGTFDAVVITTKAHATLDMAEAVAPLLGRDGILASVQNGLGNGQKLAMVHPRDRCAVAITSHGATVEAPGRIHHAGLGPTTVGPLDDADPAAARALHQLLSDAGFDPAWADSMRKPIWQKAIINAALNPLGALYGVRNGEVLDDPDLWSLCQALGKEAQALAVRARVDLADWDVVATLEKVLEATRPNKVSMLQDVEAQRVTEIEQITGRMVRLNEKLLGHMPRSEAVYGRVKALEATYLGDVDAKQTAWDELEAEAEPF